MLDTWTLDRLLIGCLYVKGMEGRNIVLTYTKMTNVLRWCAYKLIKRIDSYDCLKSRKCKKGRGGEKGRRGGKRKGGET